MIELRFLLCNRFFTKIKGNETAKSMITLIFKARNLSNRNAGFTISARVVLF